MTMTHQILWLDDQWELFKDDFMVQARKKGLELVPFAVRKEGIDELLLHPDKYDAVLTDALMPEDQENQVLGIKGVTTIEKIAHENHIPIFISTGQPGLTKDTIFRDSHENVFIKGDATDTFGGDNELFAAMLQVLGQKEISTIKRYYSDVVLALEKLNVDEETSASFLAILSAMHFPDTHTDFKAGDQFNLLRKVFEDMCKAFCKAGVLPDAFIEDGKVNIGDSYRYLTGFEGNRPQYVRYYHNGEIIPRYIAEPLKSVMFILSAKSHSATGRAIIPQSRHSLFSYTFLYCEMLVWAYSYIKNHPDYDKNKAEWVSF